MYVGNGNTASLTDYFYIFNISPRLFSGGRLSISRERFIIVFVVRFMADRRPVWPYLSFTLENYEEV